MKKKTPLTILENLLKKENVKIVVKYMRDASQSNLSRNMTGFGSLKHLAYSLRDLTDASMYELLLKDLYLVAITHPQQIHNLLTVIEKTGSARLQSFIAQIKPDADTSSLTVFQLKAGKVAFNMSTKNLASIALTKADIYIANSTEGACIMTRRIWAFDEEFQPIGFKLVHRNGFA